MRVFETHIDKENSQFQKNFQSMLQHLEELQKNWVDAREEGEAKYKERHIKSGKKLARERVEGLLDEDSYFLELMPFAGCGQKGSTLGASLVVGIGQVERRDCLIVANVPTIKGGAMNPSTVLKMQRAAKIASENALPVIYLVESAGADLPRQADIYNLGGSEFREITRRSKAKIPSIAIVFGSSTAGGAYIPGMSDYVIMVDKQAKVYLAGPPLVKMAINEDVDDETLGGARMHAADSGLADFLVEDEQEALLQAREVVALFEEDDVKRKKFEEPKHSPEDLLGIVSADLKTPFDVKEVIARIGDGSRFMEFKPLYGSSLVCGFTKIFGHAVGVIANNGILNSKAAEKGAHFVQLCNQSNKPLIFLQNTTGFMVGESEEKSGAVKHGAKLINAVANSEVPAITILMGASYGAGNYGMSGLALEPRFLFSWPNAKLAVMGGEQLAGVMELIQREQAAKTGRALDEKAMSEQSGLLKAQIEKESNAFYCSGRVWDDGVIDPRQTRDVLGICLNVIHRQPVKGSDSYGVFRM